jgi:hypothetical protein
LIIRIIFDEELRSICSSLRSCLYSTVISSLLDTNILLYTLFSNTLSLISLSMWATKFQTHTKLQANLEFCVSQSLISSWKKSAFWFLTSKLHTTNVPLNTMFFALSILRENLYRCSKNSIHPTFLTKHCEC